MKNYRSKTFGYVCGVVSCALIASAVRLSAAEFPAPVNGTVTLTEAGTYSGTFPEGMSTLSVDAEGTVKIAADNGAFTGTTVVQEGSTLIAANQYALGGESATVSVVAGGRLELVVPVPDGTGQSSIIWKPSTIIAGTGVTGNGALRVSFVSTESAMCDSGVRHLELSGDATVDFSVESGGKRWGAKTLELNEYALTRVNGSVGFQMYNNTVYPGHIVNNTGSVTLQGTLFQDCTAENLSFTVNGGTLTPWSNSDTRKIPGTIYLSGGYLYFGGSTARSYLTGPVIYTSGSGITGSADAKYVVKEAWFEGGLINKSTESLFEITSFGTNHISSLTATGGKGFIFENGRAHVTGDVSISAGGLYTSTKGYVSLEGDFDRTISGGAVIRDGGLLEHSGGNTDLSMLRIDNGGACYATLRLTGGDLFTRRDTPYCGETAGGVGVFVQEGGNFVCSNTFTVGRRPKGYGMIVQKGGTFELRRPGSDSGCMLIGNSGDGRYYQLGGTYFSQNSPVSQVGRCILGKTNSFSQVVLSGEGTVHTTERIVVGNSIEPSTNLLAVLNGAKLKCSRIQNATIGTRAAGTISTFIVDGGVICPTWGYGFSGLGIGSDLYLRNFTHTVAGERGVVVDTSECSNEAMTGLADCVFPHVFKAPAGRGIATITLPDSVKELDYRGPVPIVIEGNGYGAAAFADFDYATMSISTAVVLTAGCDYDESTKVYVLEPGGNPAKYECEYTLTSANRVPGPFTKRGDGGLMMTGTQEWGGATIVEGGTLQTIAAGTIPSGLKLVVKSGATLNLYTNDLIVTSLGGSGTITAERDNRGNVTLAAGGTIEVLSDAASGGGLTLDKGKLTVAGSVTVNVPDPDSLPEDCRKFTFVSANDGIELAEGATVTLDPSCELPRRWGIITKADSFVLYQSKGSVISFR